jgi:hypothetical protein
MKPASSLDSVSRQLTRAFRKRYKKRTKSLPRMVGFLFARPSLRFVKEEMLQNIEYWNKRCQNFLTHGSTFLREEQGKPSDSTGEPISKTRRVLCRSYATVVVGS